MRERVRSAAQHAADYFEMSGRAEFVAAAILFALMLGLKVVNITRYKFDTDESQHLHVIWGWANGFVQYRDLCDNHMPLFQIAFAPVYKLIGERATILYWMRFLLLPMYLLAAWCTYRIGALCFSRRAGVWGAIMAGSYPGYFFCSLEFRTDNVWAPLWLLCILVLLSGALTMQRAVVAGLLLGLCFGISMKTTLLLFSILVGGGLTLRFAGRERLGISRAHLARCLTAFLGSAALVPGAIMLAFAVAGLWREFRYWVFENNIVPGLMNHPAWWAFVFPIVFPAVVYAGWRIIRATPDHVLAFRRGFVFLICGFYMPALWSFWSLVTRQDYLPYHPLGFTMYVGILLALSGRLVRPEQLVGRICSRVPFVAFVAASELLAQLFLHPFWIDGSKSETDLLRATLNLTEPGDFVLDQKGETIFRQRCFGLIWEPCVMRRIWRGQMIDNAAERCIETQTCVAVLGRDISMDASRFIARNYLPVGNTLRVAGTWLTPSEEDGKRSDFELVIPAFYKITARSGPVAGILDGTPCYGARFLLPGKHSFVQTSDAIGLVALWAQAVDRHFTPFDLVHPTPEI